MADHDDDVVVVASSFLPREARSAKRGIAIVSRPSVCLLMYHEHIGWTSSKLSSLGSSLIGATTSAIGNIPKIRVE